MTLQVKQIYQQQDLKSGINPASTYFVIDMQDPVSGNWLTYRVTCSQLNQLLQCQCLVTVKTVLTSAQILALNTTPVVLVPSFGAGTIIRPIAFCFAYTFGTVAYATNTSMIVSLNGITDSDYAIFSLSGLASSVTAPIGASSAHTGVITDLENQSLTAYVLGGNPTAGDGTLTIYTSFTVITA
jgi:hypothetical protein